MGKKRSRTKYTSKGERRSVSQNIVRVVAQSVGGLDRAFHKITAWRAGKNPWITVPGPGPSMPFVKVRANAVYGNPKDGVYNMYKGKTDQ